VLSSDEEKYNVQYSATADFSILGKKLKKDAVKVKKALPSLKSQEIKDYLKNGEITVDGIKLEAEDLMVKRGLAQDSNSKDQEFNTDNDVLIILDVASYPELEQEGLAREVIRRVQDLRKKANLKPTDDVGMEYRVLSDPENVGLEAAFEKQGLLFEKALRRNVDKHVITELDGKIPEKSDETVIAEEEQELHKATFMLRLVKL
jgi:isoleucyl-tRNA synthetase